MLKLDEKFLEMMGLGDMPEVERAAFLQHLQEEAEVRVGDRLADELTDAQMEEFEKLVEGDAEVLGKVLAENGDYTADEVYRKLVDENGMADGAPETLSEYAAMKWMMKNNPEYKEIVAAVVEELKGEVEANRGKIIGS